MVLDVVPNSKMLLGSPSASNKTAGHPERPQGGERRLLSPQAPGPQQLLSATQSPAVTGSLHSTRWPQLGLDFHTVENALFTFNCIWCFGSQSPWQPGSLSQTLLCNQVTCPSTAECLGKLSHISFGSIQEKQESLVDVSPLLSLMLSRCAVSPKLVNVLSLDLSLTQITGKLSGLLPYPKI